MSGHGYYRTGANADPAKAKERYAKALLLEVGLLTSMPAPVLPLPVPKPALAPPPHIQAMELGPTMDPRQVAVASGYTGDQCSNCNSMRMKVSGHCMVCEDCGTTTGCS